MSDFVPGGKSPQKERLGRQEIIEILEHNIQLYQNDPNYASYIAELAFSLIEHSYDPTKDAPLVGKAEDHDDIPAAITAGGGVTVPPLARKLAKGGGDIFCTLCGAKLKDSGKCPACGT